MFQLESYYEKLIQLLPKITVNSTGELWKYMALFL